MWFDKLVGFKEENPNQVRENIEIEGPYLISKINGKRYRHGALIIPTLGELIDTSPHPKDYNHQITCKEVVGDVVDLHIGYEHALFQAASQFNLLEMVNPNVTPEMGVDRYALDYTQGPACAIACGAGTIFRNYFVDLDGQIGQTSEKQIDCLEEIGRYLNNEEQKLWEMRNGYAQLSSTGLEYITNVIENSTEEEYESLSKKLRIGLQLDTEVTIEHGGHTVSQAYCSALPIGYSQISSNKWEAFAQLILNATYEATFYAALSNYERTGESRLFLTLVGGGVFSNPSAWIYKAIERSVLKFRKTPLKVFVVSYGESNPSLRSFLRSLERKV